MKPQTKISKIDVSKLGSCIIFVKYNSVNIVFWKTELYVLKLSNSISNRQKIYVKNSKRQRKLPVSVEREINVLTLNSQLKCFVAVASAEYSVYVWIYLNEKKTHVFLK